MQTTSALYNSIIASQNHWFETRVRINGIYYSENQIKSISTAHKMFSSEQPTVGGCIAGELKITMLNPTASIPRMAEIRLYVRATNGTQSSEWLPQGVFFIDTRDLTHNDSGLDLITFNCYDTMLKTESDYPSTSHTWPYTDINVVKEIAKTIGLQSSIYATTGIDSRTVTLMNKGYQIPLPVGYSMREVLSRIASMYAGNWVINYEGKLRLMTLAELPEETNYLIDTQYDAITFGGDRIFV